MRANASSDEARTAYRKLSKKFHPDVNNQDKFFEERFKDIQEAFEVLSDKRLRAKYDTLLHNLSRVEESIGGTIALENFAL